MKWETHKSLVRRINSQLRNSFPSQPLSEGSVAPDQSRWRSERHHGLSVDQYRRHIWEAVVTARKYWLAGDKARAASQFGVAAHFAADALIPPYSAGKEWAEQVQAGFQRVERSFVPPNVTTPEVAWERIGEDAMEDFLVRASSRYDATGGGLQRSLKEQLRVLYECLLLMGSAVTEDAAPQAVVQRLGMVRESVEKDLSDAAAVLASRCESRYEHSFHSATEAAAHDLHELYRSKPARMSVAVSSVLKSAVHPGVTKTAKRAMRDFKRVLAEEAGYGDFSHLCETCDRSAKSEVGPWYGSYWFMIDWESLDLAIQQLVRLHERTADAAIARQEDKADSALEGLQVQFVRKCLLRFPSDWRQTLAYRIIDDEWDVWLYLLPWLLLALTSSLLWVLGVIPFAIACLGISVSIVSGVHVKERINRWRRLTDYVERSEADRQ